MDPVENLKEQLEIAKEIQGIVDNAGEDGELTEDQELDIVRHGERLADLVLALDEWIKKGGFLPARWKNA